MIHRDQDVLTSYGSFCQWSVVRNVDAKNDKQWTPLHTAASSGQFAAARLLVENGASLGAVHLVGRTPQHEASWYGNTDIIRLVLESGANVDAKRLLR